MLGGAAVLVTGCATTPRDRPVDGVVALTERSLAYAPLLFAIRQGLRQASAPRLALATRSTAEGVVSTLAGGMAFLAALPLVDALFLAEAGAPIIVVGALTRRFAGQLVQAVRARAGGGLPELLAGRWQRLICGLQTGANGTERVIRLLFFDRGAGSVALSADRSPPPLSSTLVPAEPPSGEPRWIGYPTDEALVAALVDTRVDAFVGRSMAAAQALLMGAGYVATNLSTWGDGNTSVASTALEAGSTVLVARHDVLADTRRASLVRKVIQQCAGAAAALSGPDALDAALEALPDGDGLRLRSALRLDAASLAQTIYATDGRLPPESLRRTVDLLGRATGRRLAVDPDSFVAPLLD